MGIPTIIKLIIAAFVAELLQPWQRIKFLTSDNQESSRSQNTKPNCFGSLEPINQSVRKYLYRCVHHNSLVSDGKFWSVASRKRERDDCELRRPIRPYVLSRTCREYKTTQDCSREFVGYIRDSAQRGSNICLIQEQTSKKQEAVVHRLVY